MKRVCNLLHSLENKTNVSNIWGKNYLHWTYQRKIIEILLATFLLLKHVLLTNKELILMMLLTRTAKVFENRTIRCVSNTGCLSTGDKVIIDIPVKVSPKPNWARVPQRLWQTNDHIKKAFSHSHIENYAWKMNLKNEFWSAWLYNIFHNS